MSGDGIRTNFDNNMFGGMPSRDFIYIQPHGKSWKQIDGKTDGWIGEFFGQGDEMDIISQQTGQAGIWDEALQCWIGDDPYLVASLLSDRKYQKPVVNTENGYEFLRGYPNYRRKAI